MEEEVVSYVYKQLVRRAGGYTFVELARRCGMSEEDTLAIAMLLRERGLVQLTEHQITPVMWWDAEHLELSLNVPPVADNVFRAYCGDIDGFCCKLRDQGVDALRPYTNETTLEIMLGAAAGFALAEFFKGFLGELGKKLADFVENSVKKHHKTGIDWLQLQGVRNWKEFSFSFTVVASNLIGVTSGFDAIAQGIEEADRKGTIWKLEIGDEMRLAGNEWECRLRRHQSADNEAR